MGRAKIDNPLFAKTESEGGSLKLLNSKRLKLLESKTPPALDAKEAKLKTLKDLNSKSLKVLKSLPEQDHKPTHKFKTFKLPKFKSLESQLLVRLRPDQVDYLSKLESAIMKGRTSKNKKERITKNTIIRAAVDAIQTLDIAAGEIPDEETLLARLKTALQATLKA